MKRLLILSAITAFAQTTLNLTYQGLQSEVAGPCSISYPIYGESPAGSGPFPIAVYIPGTTESYMSDTALSFISEMESLGFIAASFGYPNQTDTSCSSLNNKDACMFSMSENPSSAIGALCAVPGADCTRIVVAGVSQGSQLAVIAGNYNAGVLAAYAMSTGDVIAGYPVSMASCMDASTHTLTQSQIRAVDGQGDQFFNVPSVIQEMINITGLQGTGPVNLLPNGSGWIEILNSQVRDGIAGHGYMVTDATQWSTDPSINWGLIQNATWLCQKAGVCRARGSVSAPAAAAPARAHRTATWAVTAKVLHW
jgi:hypothetical protein